MPYYQSMYDRLAAQFANAIDLLMKAQRDGEERAMKKECVFVLAAQPKQREEMKNEPAFPTARSKTFESPHRKGSLFQFLHGKSMR